MNISECSLLELKCQDRHTENLASTCSKSQIIFILGKIIDNVSPLLYQLSYGTYIKKVTPKNDSFTLWCHQDSNRGHKDNV